MTSKIIGFESGPTSSGILTWYHAKLDCGHIHSGGWEPINLPLGTEIDCKDCDGLAADIAWLKAFNPAEIHHARFSARFSGQYHLYRRDDTSPSGFMLIRSLPSTPEIDAILHEIRISPLSPTERY